MIIDVRPATAETGNTARDNAAALAFYVKFGARPWDDVVSVRLDGPALARLAGDGE